MSRGERLTADELLMFAPTGSPTAPPGAAAGRSSAASSFTPVRLAAVSLPGSQE